MLLKLVYFSYPRWGLYARFSFHTSRCIWMRDVTDLWNITILELITLLVMCLLSLFISKSVSFQPSGIFYYFANIWSSPIEISVFAAVQFNIQELYSYFTIITVKSDCVLYFTLYIFLFLIKTHCHAFYRPITTVLLVRWTVSLWSFNILHSLSTK